MDSFSLSRLAEIARALSNYRDIEDLIRMIVGAAAELTRAEGCSLLLFDEPEKVLYYAATTWNDDNVSRRNAVESVEIPLEMGVAGWVFKTRKSVFAQQPGDKALMHPAILALIPGGVKTIAAVPVEYQQTPIGILECFNASEGSFDQSDLEVLETLASMASISIYNAHLMDKNRSTFGGLADFEKKQEDFIAIASHELRTPLGVIIGHTALLQEIADPEIAQQLAVIARNARHLKEIIENLTTIRESGSQAVRPRMQAVSLKRLVTECVRKLMPEAILAGVGLLPVLPSADVHVIGDYEKLSIVLTNLVTNAVAYSSGRPQAQVDVIMRQKGYRGEVAVADNGIGISEKDQRHIFKRFYQVENHMRRRHGGMGVGLTTAKFLIEDMGGEIDVRSVEGEGSVFTISLPLVSPGKRVKAFMDE